MAPITFAEIMNCYPDNSMVYNQIKRDCGKLVPFVGAGLSVPCYPLWPKALKELAERVAVPETKKTIVDMIEGKNPQLLEAAQALEDYWGQRGMADHLLELFSAAKIQEYKEKLPHQSVWLLPLLFPGMPAVTTNFDRVLETVYHMQGCQFDTVILPNRQELQDQLRQGERHGLLKLHGDIGSETLEYSSIIFGKRQYQAAYQLGTSIVKNLQAWFSGKMLLFLGCSLKADEYLNLLQEVVQLHPGVTHYAILERTNKKDAAARARQLRDQWGIRALFYPKGRHEAVRVILEKLLEDRNPTAYQALSTHVGALPDQSPSSRFHYKSGSVSFHGRREELEQLREFCGQEHVAFRWWAVTGAGGAGKSRLVYEFGREMEASGWNVLWLNSAHMDHLDTLPIPTKTLVVVDYAQAYLGPLGHWMEQLAQQPRLVPVRLLLLERDGESLDSSSWGSGLKAEVGRVTLVRRSCWREPFLQLNPLQEEELLRIMTDYADAAGKRLPEDKAQRLLEVLKSTDPELRRPLYAMFLTDAWVNGEKPEKWGQKAVLDYVLKRENEYFEEKLGPELYDLSDVFCQLRLVATIWNGITPERVAQEYPQLWSEFQAQSNTSNSVKLEKNLLRQVGLLQGTELAGLKPDLLGEYFVLQHVNEPEVLQLLFPDGWQAKGKLVTFLFYMYRDYHDVLENMEVFWNHMLCFPMDTVSEYGMIWVNVACASNVYAVPAVNILKALWEENEMYALPYANGLLNISSKQNLEGKKSAVERLKEMHEQYSENEKIAVVYAQGLFNLSYEQGIEAVEASVERLRELQERYVGNEEIALAYAKELVSLSAEQPMKEAETTIEQLKELHAQYCRNEEIALRYANGLFNLSYEQSVEEAEATIEQLKGLHEQYCENEEIALRYANGLYNLSYEQGVEEAEVTIERLRELQERYCGNEGIALEYAKGLFNLAYNQGVERAEATVERLRELQERYCGNEKIALEYAKGLFNLSCDQKVERAEATVERLRELQERYCGNEGIALEYAKGLVNLSYEQSVEKAEVTIEQLKGMHEQYSGSEEIALGYAKGLVNLSYEQSVEKAEVTIERLKEMHEQYSGSEEIALEYAMGLVNLSYNQQMEKRAATIRQLGKLHTQYSENEEISVAYAKGLVNLSIKQSVEEAKAIIEWLKGLHEQYSENEEISVAYAKGLVNLSDVQKARDVPGTIKRLKKLYSRYANNEEMTVAYAIGLYNLAEKQNAQEARSSIPKIESLCQKYPENEEVKEILNSLAKLKDR